MKPTRENITPRLTCRWRDTIRRSDGSEEVSPWNTNQFQNSVSTLIMALLAQEGGYTGISHFAVGSGDVAWDATPPTLDPADTTLEAEVFRKALVPATDFLYLDPDTDLVVAGPTRKLQITVTLDPSEANTDLREWALFGGTASAAADSGEMVDWKNHALIVKDLTMTITRTIILEIGLP